MDNNMMNNSSINNNNSSAGKRKISFPNWYHKSGAFEGNNVMSMSKVDQGSSTVLGSKNAAGVIDLILDTD